MSFQVYEGYRDSAVEWIGVVPSHWQLKPLIAVASECNRANLGLIENNLLSLSYGRIIRKNINDNDGLLPESFETYQIVEPNDLVWRLTDLQNDKRSLRTAIVRERGIITSAYLATTPTGVEPRYFAYLLRAYDLQKVFYSMGGGLRQGMKFSDVKQLPILLPPKEEQAVIVAFLDRETAKIDALIEEQRRLIELLKEKRQAIISHMVTKGIDPSTLMKASNIEWLGQVPAHWEVTRLKRVVPNITVGIVVEPSKYYVDAGVPALRSLNVRPGRIVPDDLVFISEDANELHAKSKLRNGDIVAVRTGQPGTAAIVPPEFDGANCVDLIIIRNGEAISERFLCWYLASDASRQQFTEGSAGAIQQHFNVAAANQLSVCIPPLSEQQIIAAELDRRSAQIDNLIRTAERAVELLTERGAALICAATTGKIDVRGRLAAPSEMEAA